MISREKFRQIAHGLLNKTKAGSAKWQAAPTIKRGYLLKLPASSLLLAYTAPPTEVDFISLGVCNAGGEVAESWQVNDGDEDWTLMQELFNAVEYQIKGVDSLLKDVEAFLQSAGSPS